MKNIVNIILKQFDKKSMMNANDNADNLLEKIDQETFPFLMIVSKFIKFIQFSLIRDCALRMTIY